MHATEGAVEVRRARRRLEDTPVTDERVFWTFHSGQRRRHAHELRPCRRLSGEARDRLWRSGSRPSISFNPASTPFIFGESAEIRRVESPKFLRIARLRRATFTILPRAGPLLSFCPNSTPRRAFSVLTQIGRTFRIPSDYVPLAVGLGPHVI